MLSNGMAYATANFDVIILVGVMLNAICETDWNSMVDLKT